MTVKHSCGDIVAKKFPIFQPPGPLVMGSICPGKRCRFCVDQGLNIMNFKFQRKQDNLLMRKTDAMMETLI